MTPQTEIDAMTVLKEFASRSNGDKWLLGKDDETGVLFVHHRGNAPSGEHETRSSVGAFLDRSRRSTA